MWIGNNTVVIIIGILAAIAIPTFLAQRDKAVIATCKSDTRNAAEAAVLFAADNDANNNDFTGLTTAGLEAQGWNQTEGYTTTVPTAGADVVLSTACPNGGTADFTSVAGAGGAGDLRGEVTYTP